MINNKITISAEMKSPFSDHYQYLQHIVLPNLADFLKNYQNNRKDIRSNSRLFINAVISMNHLPDYMFWEWKQELEEIGIKNEKKLYDHIEKMQAFSFMKDIRDVANAAKHCIRNDTTKMKAADIAKQNIHFDVEIIPDERKEFIQDFKMDSEFSSESYYEKNYSIIDKAWGFWLNYHPKKYKEIIFGKKS